MCIYIMDYQMGYEWNMSGKKTMGYFFGMCPSPVSNTAGKFPHSLR